MKKGFTLVEVIATLAIFLIGGSLVFGVFTSSSKMLNKGKELSDIQDSFRNAALSIEKQMNEGEVLGYQIENIDNYTISGYQEVKPVLLIDKGENSVLYFKGKKSNDDLEIFEKVIFDKNNIQNNNIVVKESKTIVSEKILEVSLINLSNDAVELKFDFSSDSSENIRSYFTTINLEKNESEEVIEIAAGNTQTPSQPAGDNNANTSGGNSDEIENEIVIGPSEEPVTETDVINTSNTFSRESTFIVLDQNPYNTRENLINIKSYSGNNSNINLSNASFYIQAISTDIMKKYIDTNYIIENKYEKNSTAKAPALNSFIYKASGLRIESIERLTDIINVGNNDVKYIKNGENNVACIYGKGSDYILLVNGNLDIDIDSNSDINLKAPTQGNNRRKLTIYATGEINIINRSGAVKIKDCSLISANQINIETNNIEIISEYKGDYGKLKEVLDENLVKS